MGKEIVNQVQEVQSPKQDKPKEEHTKTQSSNWPKLKTKIKYWKQQGKNDNIQGNSHQAISWFLNRNFTSQKGMAWYILSDEREETSTKNNLSSNNSLIQIWWRNQNLSRQVKVKKIQHHQISFMPNAKGTSLGRKHMKRKRPTENKPKTIKKMVIGLYILIITLSVNGLNAPTKRHRLAGQMKTCACMHFHLSHQSAWPLHQIVYNYFILLG